MYRQPLPSSTFDKIHGTPSPAFQTWLQHPAIDAYRDATNPSLEDYARIDKPILTIIGPWDHAGASESKRDNAHHDARNPCCPVIPVAMIPEEEKIAREAERRRAREIEAATVTVDRVMPGTEDEGAHTLQGQASTTGPGFGRPGRDARGGGWFSYDMKVLPDQPVCLVVTCWGGLYGCQIVKPGT